MRSVSRLSNKTQQHYHNLAYAYGKYNINKISGISGSSLKHHLSSTKLHQTEVENLPRKREAVFRLMFAG